MTGLTPNQGIITQVGTDPANLPGAQTSWDSVMENRLAQRYTSIADRTARNPAPNENELSALADVDRQEIFDGANWISQYSRSFFSYTRQSNLTLAASSTALQNVPNIVATLPTAGRFYWECEIYMSGDTASDIKFAYTFPAGATVLWGAINQNATTLTSIDASVRTTSADPQPMGLAGTTSPTLAVIKGEIIMGGTAGNLQLQAAQNASTVTAPLLRLVKQRLWREA